MLQFLTAVRQACDRRALRRRVNLMGSGDGRVVRAPTRKEYWMRRFTFRRGRWFVLGSVVGAVLAGGAAATIAAIPGADGVINGCYQKNVGNLRVIDPNSGDSCRPSEIPINWSQTGPQGAK